MVRASKGESELAEQLAAAGYQFLREYRFHPVRRWRVDFLVAAVGEMVPALPRPCDGLLVEVEGLVWVGGGGRHQRGAGFEADCEKYAEAAAMGWRLLRVTPRMVRLGAAMQYIGRCLPP